MNSKEAQIVAREAWRKSYEANPFCPVGEKHPRCKGGLKAKQQRDKENGWPSQAARRAKKSKPLPKGCIDRIGKSQKWRCVVCETSIKKKFHTDHIMPLALGGDHVESNIQLLCPHCNLKKWKKHPIDFMQSLGFLL